MCLVRPRILQAIRSVRARVAPCLATMHPENDPIFSSYILATVADWQELFWSKHVHPVYVR